MTEPGGDEPRRFDTVDAVASGAGEGGDFFEVVDRGRDRSLVGGDEDDDDFEDDDDAVDFED